MRLKFHSSRPESFAIYKRTSQDGEWIPFQFYSATCRDSYGLPEDAIVTKEDETRPLCTSEFSDISPLTGGNVAFSTLEGRPSASKFEESFVLQEWVTATDIRIALDRINTFGDEVFGDPKVLKSYFYAISDFAVGGRCKCNGHGSECYKTNGGLICQCEHNTDGPDCEKCLPFYNDKPWGRATGSDSHECQPCNCHGRSSRCYFDQSLYEQTGHGGHCMNCTDNTDGANCERCRQSYYQRQDNYCVPCDCNEIGSLSQQCNNQGRCQCRTGVSGEKCDRCEANFYDFSIQGCRPCGCSISGSFGNSPNCDTINGTCQCKNNVEGRRCDRCKPGFFNLDQDNEFGCTPCFCYGHSSVCQSAPGYSQYNFESTFARDAERWTAKDKQGNAIPMQYNALVQNIAVSASHRETVYFVAPSHFLEDQRGSYNQHLTFTFRINQEGPRATIEDIKLEGAGLSISQPIFGQGNQLPTTVDQEYKFRLHEHPNYGWEPRLIARDFISILANLTAIKIRATYTPGGIGFLDNVKLESTQRGGYGQEAMWIEMCSCLEGYIGQYCESCAPGYRHDPPGNDAYARCIPCNCHQHADICDDASGRCMCQDNTAGDYCERCKRGYYGNALMGTAHDCQPCPCPNQGSCIDLGNNEIACLECPEGYGGHLCDICTDGYFGDPQEHYGSPRPCQKCDCNANIDANAVGNCNRTSGKCQKCIYSTSGSHCEVCLPGYYGDALAIPKGDCKPCNCNPLGSIRRGYESIYCDAITGQCECQPNVYGQRCDNCLDGYWNLNQGSGCESCNCDPIGSLNQTCDIYSGQCQCHPGVTGQHCNQCTRYYYAFSYDGCKNCDCDPVGSTSLQCDLHTGQCQCNDNVEGRTCSRCKENKYDKHAGCIECPPCYSLVQKEVNIHRGKLGNLRRLLDDIEKNPQLVDDLDFNKKLQDVLKRVNDLLRDAENAGGEDKSILQQLEELHDRLKVVQTTAHKIGDKLDTAKVSSQEGVRNITEAEEIIARIREALKNAERILEDDGEAALQKAKERSEKFGQQSERMSQIAREASQLAEKQEEEATAIDDTAKKAHNMSQEAYTIANNALNKHRDNSDEIKKLQREVMDVQELMNRTKALAGNALQESSSAYDNALELYTEVSGIILPEDNVKGMMQSAAEITEEAKKIQQEADDLMKRKRDLVDEIEGQMAEAELLLENGEEQQQIADKLFADVDAANAQAQQAVESGEKTLEEANKTLHTLKGFDRLVQQSREKAEDALERVEEIEQLINQAEQKTKDAKDSLAGAQQNAKDSWDIAKEAQEIAEAASADANSIMTDADETREQAAELNDDANDLDGKVVKAADRLKGLEDTAEDDRHHAREALELANQAKSSALESTRRVKGALDTVNEILDILGKVGEVDLVQLGELERKLAAAERELRDAELDRRMGEVRAARTQQSQWMRDYEKDLIKLRVDVLNIRAISSSLPDQCYRRIKLEP